MKQLRLVTLFALCLLIKVSLLRAEEASKTSESDPKVKVSEAPVVTTANGVRVETKTIETETTPSQQHSNTKSEGSSHAPKHFEGSSETKIQNNITIDGRGLAYGAVPAAAAPAIVSAVAQEATSAARPVSITPIAGMTGFQGIWYNNILSRGTVGLILDIPIVSVLSLEAEGQYSRIGIRGANYGVQPLNQYTGGGNAKITLGRGLIQPYFGAGMMAVYYEGMPQDGSYQPNQAIGAGQVVAGADLNLFGVVSVGARGEYLRPMTNLPPRNSNGYTTMGNGVNSPLTADFYRILGTVKVSF